MEPGVTRHGTGLVPRGGCGQRRCARVATGGRSISIDSGTWDPHAGRDLLIYATERGGDLDDEVLPRPKGP